MRLSHTLLIGLAAVLWGTSRIVAPPPPKVPGDVPVLALPGSAFGSLAARTMRSSLYSYWHAGEAFQAAAPTPPPQVASANTPPPTPPPKPGVFSRRRLGSPPNSESVPSPSPVPAPEIVQVAEVIPAGPPLDRASNWLSALEKRRTRRQGSGQMSAAHSRFVNSAAGWRLRLAYTLDPGDPVLYEILHMHILATTGDVAQARERSRLLTEQALKHAHSSQAGMADALTGVGAAINAFNEILMPPRSGPLSKDVLLANWQDITSCQMRFREARSAAEREGWWKNIPENRRVEIDGFARDMDQLIGKIHQFLKDNGVVVSHQ